MVYQLRAKNLFLTYPQCSQDPWDVMERIQWHFDWKWAVVGQEKHQDGNLHLHIALALNQPLSTRDATFADFLTGQHGNYQGMRDVKKCLAYVTKGGNYCVDGIDLAAAMRGGRTNQNAGMVSKMVADGATVEEIHEAMPEYFVANLSKVQAYIGWRQVQSLRLREPRWFGCLGAGDQGARVAEWLNTNLLRPRVTRQKQLWVHGPTGLGKTYLLDALRARLRCYEIPKGEDFYDFYDDGCYDLSVMDEFRGQKTVTWLNEWLQGTVMTVRKKGSQALKSLNLPCIICSNYSPAECFPKVPRIGLEALESRLVIVSVFERLVVSCCDA